MSLGVVPVEEDGSVHCQAPVGKLLQFQALDENMMAIQSMRTATYVHPGERLTCIGCHEDKWQTPSLAGPPHGISTPAVGVDQGTRVSRADHLLSNSAAIFEGTCLPCHRAERQGPQNMDYEALQDYAFYFSGAHMNNYSNPR